MTARLVSVFLLFVLVAPVWADGPADNNPETVRRVPSLGIEVPAADAEQLQAGLKEFAEQIKALRQPGKDDRETARRQELLPDVEIYHKAVHDALEYREFFNAGEIPVAKALLEAGRKRAEQLLKGEAPWTTQTGLVVRGYRSKIDQSVQPYGLVIPDSYAAIGQGKSRLDLWFHGRGETLSELSFVNQRQAAVGPIAPKDAIVVHPYGRYCNANKLAGEIDSLEVLESVKRRYRIDDDRISVRGFSMGGAACWQFAVHYADRWAAAAPGAGFSETPEFLRFFQDETLDAPWFEQKLFRWYDCTEWAVNLAQCPTVAYSGEFDSQKQAAGLMEIALAKQGIPMVHIIGPGAGHNYTPAAAAEIERRMTSIMERGRDRIPQTVRFTTYSLRYNRMHWLTVDGLAEHWEPGTVTARYSTVVGNNIQLATKGVTDLSFHFEPGWCPFEATRPVTIEIDRQPLRLGPPSSDRSWDAALHRDEKGQWVAGARSVPEGTLRKLPGLQGPIDDAFLDSFLFVKPSGKSANEKVQQWASAELERAVEHWRRQYRGQAPVKLDKEVTDADIAASNLILWGDPESNAILQKIAGQLPIAWDGTAVKAGSQTFAAKNHALIAIYPNPLNPKRYVVLNSGFTFREYDYLNNARQTPKLPDWAIVDVDTPPNSRWPGKIVAADFFGENWELRPSRKK